MYCFYIKLNNPRYGMSGPSQQYGRPDLQAELNAKLNQRRLDQARELENERRQTLEKMAKDLCVSTTTGGSGTRGVTVIIYLLCFYNVRIIMTHDIF